MATRLDSKAMQYAFEILSLFSFLKPTEGKFQKIQGQWQFLVYQYLEFTWYKDWSTSSYKPTIFPTLGFSLSSFGWMWNPEIDFSGFPAGSGNDPLSTRELLKQPALCSRWQRRQKDRDRVSDRVTLMKILFSNFCKFYLKNWSEV